MFGCDSAAAARTSRSKRLDGVGAFEPFLANPLEGADAAEVAVAGLEHLAHRPFAQPLQEDVRPQNKLLAASLEQLVGLVGREPVAADEFFGEGLRLGETRSEVEVHLGQLAGIQQTELAKGVHQGVGRGGCHGLRPARGEGDGLPDRFYHRDAVRASAPPALGSIPVLELRLGRAITEGRVRPLPDPRRPP